jgi:uroporphyrinogen decarboxylase
MNGKQRIEAALCGEWPDARPLMLHNFLMAAREYGVTMLQYRSDPEVIAGVHIQAVEKYDLDGVLIDVDTATLAGAVGVPVDFPENEPARAHGRKLDSLQQVEELEMVDISKDERVQIWLESCRIVKKYFGEEKYVRGNCDQAPFSLAAMMRSMTEWMMDLLSDDDRVHTLLEYCTEITGQFIRLMAETGVDMVSNGDSTAGPDMISPDMYVQYALPYEKKIVAEAHRLNRLYMLHICGNTNAILEQMVTCGADALEMDYKTDIGLVRQACAKQHVTFSGNIDPVAVIALGTPGMVEARVRQLLHIYRDEPRLIVNAGCAIPTNTPEENIRALVRTVRNAEL